MFSQGPDSAVNGGRVPGGSLQDSGIMVLASDRQVLYLNKAGRDLLLRFNEKENENISKGLPKPLVSLIDEIHASREVAIEDRGWRRFGRKRLVEAQGRSLFVQVFVQAREIHRPRPVIVLTMQSGEISAPSIE